MSKVALVTGASSGIGHATAERLLDDGYTVYVAARRVEKMKDLEEKGAISLQMDVTKEEDLIAGVKEINERHGGVDILVNNAGFGQYGPMEDTPLDDARYQFDVNVFGLARLTQLVLPHMREQKAGRIVNITSMGGKIYTPLGSWYHATKHALEGWSDCLRLELKEFGIDVIIVEPGAIETEFGDVLGERMFGRSDGSAYQEFVERMLKATEQAYERGGGSPPSLIANVISKAVAAPKPKTRYAAGKYAKPMMFMRKWFGDRVFDRVLMSQFT
jgi:NAD(P)-dependent dehydrogenase (short-subunit alcohol dehydrogenase family)